MHDKKIRIVFFGTPEFAVESLSRLVDEMNGTQPSHEIVGVVTAPDKPAGRGHKMLKSAVKEYYEKELSETGIPLMQPVSLKAPEFIETLRALDADLFIVIAFRMLPEAVWAMPPMGTFNLHGSLLPRYRGAAPINRAIMNGETETGVTTFMLKHEIDTGDILRQVRIPVTDSDDFGSIYTKLQEIGAGLTLETVRELKAGTLKPIPQDELAKDVEPCPAPKIFAEDMVIDWSCPAAVVRNLVRGLSPYPGARATLSRDNGGAAETIPVKVFATAIYDGHCVGIPGQIEIIGGTRLIVKCGDDTALEILEFQPAGKKRMAVADYLRGARLKDARFV